MTASRPESWRKSTQPLAPLTHEPTRPGKYDPYPFFPLGAGRIQVGFDALARVIAGRSRVLIDGYVGVLWEPFREELDRSLRRLGIQAQWVCTEDALLNEARIERIVGPFLGGDDPLFGKRFEGALSDFFDRSRLRAMLTEGHGGLTIVYGCGAALVEEQALVVYVDLPKNELQFRARAGAIRNLGVSHSQAPKVMYKRFYFVDWPALNRHKADCLHRFNLIVDGQRPREPVMMSGEDFRGALQRMSRGCFRARPWFEPGPWGGQWIKQHLSRVSPEPPNYAWSFELIAPENGIVLEGDGRLLEVSFDWLMFAEHEAVLGECADVFGADFPIRFDFLDTFDGGNLSVQCHPRLGYIREHFGETITQDETYYILDCAPGAEVYLGFREGIDAASFRDVLESSHTDAHEVDIRRYVQTHPARKHDLFLIPHGTIHCSGRNNMVLEISATPYIFTFKMYDWLRLDLDGQPRPLNIQRAFENLNFKCQGDVVCRELIRQPRIIERGEGWSLTHLPTHRDHFYDVHRYEFVHEVAGDTRGSCHVMSLVEGRSILLETADGMRRRFNYAETFIVPAAAERYRLINEGPAPVKVIKAFIKEDLSMLRC